MPGMKPAEHPTALRVQAALDAQGITTAIVEFDVPTRTSAEAAAAIGCGVAQIAKSVVMRGLVSGRAVVVVASGSNRVSEAKVAALVGEALGRADAAFVRAATGYAIGGVAPFGHATPVTLLLDAELQQFDRVWAAGGTPHSVFSLSPAQLAQLTGAGWRDIREG